MPMQIGQTCVLGAALAYPVWQEQNILLFVSSCECTSRPITTSKSVSIGVYAVVVIHRPHLRYLVTQPCECHPFIYASLVLSTLFVNRKWSSHQGFSVFVMLARGERCWQRRDAALPAPLSSCPAPRTGRESSRQELRREEH